MDQNKLADAVEYWQPNRRAPSSGRPTDPEIDSSGTLLPYQPTLRERIALMLGGDTREGTQAARGMLDNPLNPLGAPLSAYDAGRDLGESKFGQAAVDAAGALPMPDANLAKAMFFGPGALGANKAMMKWAEEMARSGSSMREVFDQTGHYLGPEGIPRFESGDATSKFKRWPLPTFMGEPPISKLSDILDHPSLFENYPQLADLPVERMKAEPTSLGGLAMDKETLMPAKMALNVHGNHDPRDTVLHEAQHAIQALEGWDAGGSPWMMIKQGHPARPIYDELIKLYDSLPEWKSIPRMQKEASAQREAARQFYNKLAGEVEANNVLTRRDWLPEQRAAMPPFETQKYPYDQQFFGRDVLQGKGK